jgi:hypothetical protein
MSIVVQIILWLYIYFILSNLLFLVEEHFIFMHPV